MIHIVENQTDTNKNNQTQPPDNEEPRKKRAAEPRVTHINLSINLSNSFLDACMTE